VDGNGFRGGRGTNINGLGPVSGDGYEQKTSDALNECINADDFNGCQGMSTENSTPLAESIPLNTALTKVQNLTLTDKKNAARLKSLDIVFTRTV